MMILKAFVKGHHLKIEETEKNVCYVKSTDTPLVATTRNVDGCKIHDLIADSLMFFNFLP